MASPNRSLSPRIRQSGSAKGRVRSLSLPRGQAERSPSRQSQGRAQSQVPSSRQAKIECGFPPNGWTPVTRDPPSGLLSHPLDAGAEELFQCIFERGQLVGLLAEPHAKVRGLVVTSPGAGGGPGPADPQGGGGGGTYGGYNVYRELAASLPRQGIAVLLVHYPNGEPSGDRATRVSRTSDHLQTLTMWYQARVQWAKIPTVLIGWSMGGAVVVEAAARMIHARRANMSGVATIASQTAGILQTSPPLIVKSGCKLLLMAGSADTCLSPSCTIRLGRMASVEPEIFPGEDHGVESALGRLALWIPDVFRKVEAAATPTSGYQGIATEPRDFRSRIVSRGKSPTRAAATRLSPRSVCQSEIATPIGRQLEIPGRSGTPCKLPKLPTSRRPGTANSTDSLVSVSPTCTSSIRQGRTGLHGKLPTSASASVTCASVALFGDSPLASTRCGHSSHQSRSSSRCRLPKVGSSSRPSTVDLSEPAFHSLPENRSSAPLDRSGVRCNSPICEKGNWSRSRSAALELSTLPGKGDLMRPSSGGCLRSSTRRQNSTSIRDGVSSCKAAATWDTAHKSPDLQVLESGLVIKGPEHSKHTWHAAFVQTPAEISARGSSRRFDFLIEEIGDGLIELGLATQNQAKKSALHWPGLRNTSAWTYASNAQRFWNIPGADEATWSQPFGEPYGNGDTVSIEINRGELRFGRNGQMQGTVSKSLPEGELFLGATLCKGSRVRLVSDVIQR